MTLEVPVTDEKTKNISNLLCIQPYDFPTLINELENRVHVMYGDSARLVEFNFEGFPFKNEG